MEPFAPDRPSLYLETTIVGYLASRPSRDALVSFRRELTRQWWNEESGKYRLFVSPQVIAEAQAGDPIAAAKRLEIIEPIELLQPTRELESLAGKIQLALAIPDRARLDAFHLSYAVQYELDYLLTWNCVPLANAPRLRRLADYLQAEALWLPIICTPAEMVSQTEES